MIRIVTASLPYHNLLFILYISILLYTCFMTMGCGKEEGSELGAPQTPAGGLRPPAPPAELLRFMTMGCGKEQEGASTGTGEAYPNPLHIDVVS